MISARFDSNYHYVVPELSQSVEPKLNYNKPLEKYKEAKAQYYDTASNSPLSFILLGKKELLSQLKEEGVEYIQD